MAIFRRSGGSGFTLVELLVALSVMALLALVSWRGLDGMVRTQEQTRTRGDALLVLQAVLAQWGTDLDALQTLPQTTPLHWDGQVLRLTRRNSTAPGEGSLVVAWTRRNVQGTDHWLRWQSPPLKTRGQWQEAWQQAGMWARNPGDTEKQRETVLFPLEGWQIFYYRSDAWSNPLSSSGTPTQDGGNLNTTPNFTLPDGVRLQLELPPGPALAGQITRDWVNPLKGGGKT